MNKQRRVVIFIGAVILISSYTLMWESISRRINHEISRSSGSLATLQRPHHIVFLGDSLTRYRFLERTYRAHFHKLAPDWLIHHEFHRDWQTFLVNTTNVFEGFMTCDCARGTGENFSLGQECENRYYSHPRGKLNMTFIEVFGDNMLHGHYLPNETHLATPRSYESVHWTKFKWGYLGNDLDKFISDYLVKLQPTRIEINVGHWPHARTMGQLKNIFKAALKLTPDVVWYETNPVNRTLGSARELKDIDQKVLEIQRDLPIHYIPFPSLNLTSDDYADNAHFSKASIYHQWNTYVPENTKSKFVAS